MKITKTQLKQIIKEELEESTDLQEIFNLFSKGEEDPDERDQKGERNLQSAGFDNYDTKEFRIRFSLAGQTSFGASFKVTKRIVEDYPELEPFLNKSINLHGRLLPTTKQQLLKLGFVDKSAERKKGAEYDPSTAARGADDLATDDIVA